MPAPDELLTIAVKFRLGEFVSEELPSVATTLLEDGRDTPSLRDVSGDLHPTMAGTGATFSRALTELGVELTREEAVLLRAEWVAESIRRGECSPLAGASEIYYLQRHHGGLPQLDAFLSAYWKSREDERTQDRVLRDEALKLVADLRASVAPEQRRRAV